MTNRKFRIVVKPKFNNPDIITVEEYRKGIDYVYDNPILTMFILPALLFKKRWITESERHLFGIHADKLFNTVNDAKTYIDKIIEKDKFNSQKETKYIEYP